MIPFESYLESLGSPVSDYYRPDVCGRRTRFSVDDPERLNRALTTLESYLSGFMGICEARVVVCLFLYEGLTYWELQSITRMKQSAVSRTITSLKKKNLVVCRVGKKYEVGRPYQYVVLNVEVDDLIECIGGLISRHSEDVEYMRGWLENGVEEEHVADRMEHWAIE